MVGHLSTIHQEVPDEVLVSPVTGMGVEETSASIALLKPEEARPLPSQSPLQGSYPQQLLLEKAPKSALLRGQQPRVHRNIQSKNHLSSQEDLHLNVTDEL
jgi:hypothetical protein